MAPAVSNMALTLPAFLVLIIEAMLKFGSLILILILLPRDSFLEFGTKVFGLPVEDVTPTVAYRTHMADDPRDVDLLFRTKVLAYAVTVWSQHSRHIQDFVLFCRRRSLSIFECTPSVVNLYLLHIAKNGISFGTLCAAVDAISFVCRFYQMPNHATHSSVLDAKKFLSKVCCRVQNKKSAFDSAADHKLWDSMLLKYVCIENIPLLRVGQSHIRTSHIFALWKCANVQLHIFSLFKNVRMCDCTFCRSLKICESAIALFVAL